jgi:hypothetical protein
MDSKKDSYTQDGAYRMLVMLRIKSVIYVSSWKSTCLQFYVAIIQYTPMQASQATRVSQFSFVY